MSAECGKRQLHEVFENYLSDSQRFQEIESLLLLVKFKITSCSDNFLNGTDVKLNATEW